MQKISMEELEAMLPKALQLVLSPDPHKHTKFNEPCVDWLLDKENSLKLLKTYIDRQLRELFDMKIQLKREARLGKEELFYDHTRNRIYKRALSRNRQYPDLPSVRAEIPDRIEATSEEEGIPF